MVQTRRLRVSSTPNAVNIEKIAARISAQMNSPMTALMSWNSAVITADSSGRGGPYPGVGWGATGAARPHRPGLTWPRRISIVPPRTAGAVAQLGERLVRNEE